MVFQSWVKLVGFMPESLGSLTWLHSKSCQWVGKMLRKRRGNGVATPGMGRGRVEVMGQKYPKPSEESGEEYKSNFHVPMDKGR